MTLCRIRLRQDLNHNRTEPEKPSSERVEEDVMVHRDGFRDHGNFSELNQDDSSSVRKHQHVHQKYTLTFIKHKKRSHLTDR
ncbi:uncharacterized protein V6R79_020721 [Siganus canaliculatus]